jgi:hypothetical protein
MHTLDRSNAFGLYPVLPSFSYDVETDTDLITFPQTLESFVLSTPAVESPQERIFAMAQAVGALADFLESDRLVFMAGSATPWRQQQNAFPPAAAALDFLSTGGIAADFNGAIIADRSELPEVLQHLIWIIRCNASLPEIYFTDARQQVLGNICSHGNLHLYSLTAGGTSAVQACLNRGTLQPIGAGGCSSAGAMEGRELSFE